MPLAGFAPKRRKITYDGGSFEVRAISLPDVAGLVTRNRDVIDAIAAIVEAQQVLKFSDDKATTDIVLQIVRESPLLVADIISACADEPEAFSEAMKLPITVQLDALRAICEMTFADIESLKKFGADVKSMLLGILPPTAATAA